MSYAMDEAVIIPKKTLEDIRKILAEYVDKMVEIEEYGQSRSSSDGKRQDDY